MPAMSLALLLAAGKVWTYWLSVPLVAVVLAAVVGLVGGYLRKVQSLKSPKR